MSDTNTTSVHLPRNTSLLGCGSSLQWRNLTVKVPLSRRRCRPKNTICDIQDQPPQSSKTILSNVSGYVEPGQLLFIMGPSGSGKSTLLDALADRIKFPVSGIQYLNGCPKTSYSLKAAAKYVQQTDDLMGVLTVKETLETAAALYIPDPAARALAVLDVLDILGLTAHAQTKIGNAFVRGLSGGQIRRVSIGCELVAAPHILFLDEPTSGLDSASAFNIMAELRRIVKTTAMAMIVTVHQPSELVFEMADTLLLISDGHMCYFGAADQAAEYFRNLGLEQPPRSSDVEWMLDAINRDFGHHETVDLCIHSWPKSETSSALFSLLESRGVPSQNSTSDLKHTSRYSFFKRMQYAVSFGQQTYVLTRRGILNSIRNPAVLWLRFAMYVALSLMIGLVWFQLEKSAQDIINMNNALFYACAFMIFMSVSVLPAYLEERSVLLRERANGAYSIAAYIIAHTLYEVPYVFLLSVTASLITYYLVGLSSGLDRLLVFIANLFMSLFVAESMMVLISAMIPIPIVGIATGAMIFGVFMCVQGAFISIDRIRWYLRWLKFIAVHFYSYSTFLVNQHRGQVYSAAPDNEFPPYPNDVTGETVYRKMGLEERIWVNFVVQLSMVFIYRGLAAFWLHVFAKGKR